MKELRTRVKSVKNIEKITSSMKMVAAAKLRKTQEAAEFSRPFMAVMRKITDEYPTKLDKADPQIKHLIVPVTSDKGLCGSINANVVREMERQQKFDYPSNKMMIVSLGAKGTAGIARSRILSLPKFQFSISEIGRKPVSFIEISDVASRILKLDFDVATIIYNKFVSAMTQQMTPVTLLSTPRFISNGTLTVDYEIEGEDEKQVLSDLNEFIWAGVLYQGILDNMASELGARMTSMDNAATNSAEIAKKLEMQYNRTRQAAVTTELAEIISGAEAVKDTSE